jgi:hypothetical protein
MSYGLDFLRKTPDQSWEEALDTTEEETGADRPGARPDAEVWARIVADARQVLGEVGLHEDDDYFELDHERTGIQLSLYAASAGLTVPYWYSGAEAETVVGLVYRLALIVERHTGLAGYDPQTGLAVSDAAARPELAVQVFDQTAVMFARRGIRSPGNDH